MTARESFFRVHDRDAYIEINISGEGSLVGDLASSREFWQLVEQLDNRSVVLFRIDEGALAPERLDQFWKEAAAGDLGPATRYRAP